MQSREAGCDGHLVKPVSLPDLEKLLKEIEAAVITRIDFLHMISDVATALYYTGIDLTIKEVVIARRNKCATESSSGHVAVSSRRPSKYVRRYPKPVVPISLATAAIR